MEQKHLKNIISFLVGANSAALPLYLSVYAQQLGANFSMIGIVTAIYALTGGISFYLFGRFSDLKAIRKVLIVSGLFFMFLTGVFHYFVQSINGILVARALFGIAAGIYTGPMIAYLSEDGNNLRQSVSGFLSFGALGWAAGSIGAGYAANFLNYNQIFLYSSFPVLLAFIVGLFIEHRKISSIEVPFFPIAIIRRNLKVILAFLVRHSMAHAIWALFTVYILSLKGGTPTIVAAALGINPLVQFFIMSSIPRMKYSSLSLFKIGLIVSTAGFFAIGFSPSAYYLIPSMAIIGVSWSFIYTGANLYLLERNPEKATIAGILHTTMSLSMIIGPIIGGVLSDIYGMRLMILIVSAVSLLALFGEFVFKNKI